MVDAELPFDARTNEIFPTKVWVANLAALEPYRANLIADVIAATDANDEHGGLSTEPVLHERVEPWWTECHEMVREFTHALAANLVPGFKHRTMHSWGTVRRSAADYTDPVDPLTTYQGATYCCVLPLQIPDELAGEVTMALRDPLFHVHNRLGFHTDCAVVPSELRLVAYPAYLERFARTPGCSGTFCRPAVNLTFDVWYY